MLTSTAMFLSTNSGLTISILSTPVLISTLLISIYLFLITADDIDDDDDVD